ncbi:MAG: hypothetical protein NC082_01285 [Clostridiales bacterium]|nr:hypothetical protein [Clostridiales bacterium]
MWTFVKNILQLIISPDNGWEDTVRSNDRAGTVLPMGLVIMVASLSIFVPLLYSTHVTVLEMNQMFVTVNVSLWATYFIADSVMSWVLPRLCDGVYDEHRVRSFTAYTVALLSLQILVSDILPITFAILELWPLYVVIIMWRGMKILDCPQEHTGKYLLVVILAFIATSQLLLRGFKYVIMS